MVITASDRMRGLTAGIFSELAACKRKAAAAGVDVIDLSIGSPDLAPPVVVMETLSRAAQDPANYGYTLSGSQCFHSAVADFYQKRYGVSLDPETEILQLMGSQDGLAHLPLAVLNPGDIVLVPDPGYPIYQASVHIAGAIPFPMPLLEENGFLPQLDQIPAEVLAKAKLMILSYPGNPVTALADAAFFERVAAFARQHNILVAHDFAYSELIFDDAKPVSFLSVPGSKEVVIEFNSLSKTFNMAGCRIAYAVGHPQTLSVLGQLKSHIDYGVFDPIQRAAVAALTSDHRELADQRKVYERRRDTLVAELTNSGWRISKPQATMFAWARIPAGWSSARAFAFDLLDETGVAVTPGDAFGSQGEGYVRIALVQPEARLREAARRIGEFLKKREKL